MKILNYGSLNIDHVYGVEHFVRPGETIGSTSYARFCGGKGLNQSVALARAGAEVWHAGKIGAEGNFLKERLSMEGVNVDYVAAVAEPTGHAVIQVDSDGENAIVIHGGANRAITRIDAERVLASFASRDIVLLQNEISALADVMALAAAKGMRVVFNPAPFAAEVLDYPLQNVALFILNETEGQGLTGRTGAEEIAAAMRTRFPNAAVIVTLGARGALYMDAAGLVKAAAQRVVAMDTTAAGDTFIGFFLALYTGGLDVGHCLEAACRAAALCVTRAGAADAIPALAEVTG
jgi:ribokinase